MYSGGFSIAILDYQRVQSVGIALYICVFDTDGLKVRMLARFLFGFFGLECRDHIPKFYLPARTMMVNVEKYVKHCLINC